MIWGKDRKIYIYVTSIYMMPFNIGPYGWNKLFLQLFAGLPKAYTYDIIIHPPALHFIS